MTQTKPDSNHLEHEAIPLWFLSLCQTGVQKNNDYMKSTFLKSYTSLTSIQTSK